MLILETWRSVKDYDLRVEVCDEEWVTCKGCEVMGGYCGDDPIE